MTLISVISGIGIYAKPHYPRPTLPYRATTPSTYITPAMLMICYNQIFSIAWYPADMQIRTLHSHNISK